MRFEDIPHMYLAMIRRRHQLSDLSLVGVTYNQCHARKLRDLFGSTLRITAGNDDTRIGILSMDTANDLANFGIRGIRDRAGIEDHELR